MNDEKNIVLFCKFIKISIEKYGNIVRKILDSDLEEKYKKIFLLNILSSENTSLLELLKENDLELILDNLDIEESIFYKLLNNKQIFVNISINKLEYYKELCDKLYENDYFS